MNCLVLPVSIILSRRQRLGSRLHYRHLSHDDDEINDLYDQAPSPSPSPSASAVRVVVGKEKKEFLVDPFILQEYPFRVLIDLVREKGNKRSVPLLLDDDDVDVHRIREEGKRVIHVDHVDAILFEHLLWLMSNDSSSLFQLNINEIFDFYAQD